MMASQECPHLDVTIGSDNLSNDFFQVLQLIRSEWKTDNIVYEVSPIDISHGLINTMVKCYNKENPQDAIMIRIHNTKLMTPMMDRSTEVTCIKGLKHLGCAPNILATFRGGFCYEFIHGVILNSRQLGQEPMWSLIAEELAKMHSTRILDGGKLNGETELWKVLDMWSSSFPESLSDPEKDLRMKTELPSKDKLFKEAMFLKEKILELKCPVVLCHNDTRAENIIWNEKTGVVKFVDFEVMGYSYQAAEIASHFTRYAGLAPPDVSLIPSEEFQMKWINAYLRKFYDLTGRTGDEVTAKDVRTLFVQSQKLFLFLMIAAGIAGPVMEARTLFQIDFEDVDFLGFAVTYTQEYFKKKEQIMQLQIPI